MIIKEMFYIPIKLKPELARASMTTSDVKNRRGYQEWTNQRNLQYFMWK
jgi:hypothetical protein